MAKLNCIFLLALITVFQCAWGSVDLISKEKYPAWFPKSVCAPESETVTIEGEAILSAHYDPDLPAIDMVLHRDKKNRWLIKKEDWQKISNNHTSVVFDSAGMVILSRENHVIYRIDSCISEIWIQVGDLKEHKINFVNGKILKVTPASPGAFLNIDSSYGGYLGENRSSTLLDFGLFSGFTAARSDFIVGSYAPVRLQSFITQDDPDNANRFLIGDTITHVNEWENSARFGGIQWGTNYALQPQRITFPLPTVSGTASIPTTADIFVNNQKITQQAVPQGNYQFVGVPTLSGAGDLTVVLRDPLGRDQSVSVPFYASTRLLSEGLSDNTYELGALREDYAGNNDRYGKGFGALTQRYGFTDYLTGSLRFEAVGVGQVLGFGSNLKLGSVGLVSVAAAASGLKEVGAGYLSSLGFERIGQTWSIYGQRKMASSDYGDLGRDPGSLHFEDIARISYNSKKSGSLSVIYNNERPWNGEGITLAGFGYNTRINRWMDGQLSYLKTMRGEGSDTFLASVTVLLANRNTVNIQVTDNNHHLGERYSAQHSPVGALGWAYEASLDRESAGSQNQAEASYSGESGTLGAGFAGIGGTVNPLLFARTGLTFMDNSLFMSRPVNNSFAIIDTAANTRVYQDNLFVGKTNESGKILISDLRAFDENRLRIEDQDISIFSNVDEFEKFVVPPENAGILVSFHVDEAQSSQFEVVQLNGSDVPEGSVVILDNEKQELPSGLGGLVYLKDSQKIHKLKIVWDGGQCVIKMNPEKVKNLGVLKCEK